jgi:hypothetical protein
MPLFTTIEELKPYGAPANLAIEMATFYPSCRHIEETILVTEIGRPLYKDLLAAYNASITNTPTPLPEPFVALIHEVRKALAPLAMLHYKNSVMVQMSEAGAVEKSGENAMNVRLWVNSLHTETMEREGYAALDNLLAFLDEHKADYPTWTNSDAFTQYKALLLQTTSEFNAEVNIASSRRLFRSLAPAIKFVEAQAIKKNIGTALYNRLVAGKTAGDLTAEEKEVLTMLISAIANFTIAQSNLPFSISTGGAFILSSAQGNSGQNFDRNAPGIADVKELKAQHHRIAQTYLEDAIDYLNKTASDSILPEYYNSPLYSNPNTTVSKDINEDLKNIFAL